MSDNPIFSMTTLDQMVSDDEMQALKAAIPYIPQHNQPLLSIFLKFLEFQKTIQLFQKNSGIMRIASANDTSVSLTEMLQDIRQYTTGNVRETIDHFINTLQMFQIFQAYQEMEDES